MDTHLDPKRAFIPFDRPLPLVGVDPDDDSDLCFVSFNSAWMPYILGALSALTRVEAWEDSVFTDRNEAAQQAHLLLERFMYCGTGDALQIRACDCGIEWSTDGSTWTCINLTSCIADIVTTGILDSLANGIIAAPGVTPTGETTPEPGECKTYHVQMSAADAWLLPIPLSTGDTVEITNLKGAWTDGDLVPTGYYGWACPDGDTYYLGVCVAPWQVLESDPFQDAYHLELVLQFGDSHALPVRGLVTIPGDIDNLDAIFVPNYSRDPLGFGTIDFDVTICKSSVITWCKTWDFSASNGGFGDVNGQTSYASFGGVMQWGSAQLFDISQTFEDMPATSFESVQFTYTTYGPRSMQFQLYDTVTATNLLNAFFNSDGDEHVFSAPIGWTSGHDLIVRILCNDSRGVTIESLTLRGTGTNPFGEDNC